MKFKHLLLGVCCMAMGNFAFSNPSYAVDCTGTLPAADCTLDENTTAPLTLNTGVTLTVGASVNIDHTVDGNGANGFGTVQTNSGGVAVTQNAAIGSIAEIDNLIIGDGDSWVTSSSIITNNDGIDIDLGAGDGGEILTLNGGAYFKGEIDGHIGDTLNIGLDGLGGTVTGDGQVETVNLNIVSGTFVANNTLGSGFGLNSITVADGAVLTLGGSAVSSGALDLDGVVNIVAGSSLQAATFVVDADSGQFNLGINKALDTTSSASITITGGGAVDLSGEVVTFNIESGTEVLTSVLVEDVIVGNVGATIAPTIDESSFLYDFAFVADGNNLDLSIQRTNLGIAADTINNLSISQLIMEDLDDFANVDIQQLQANLSNASTRQAYNDILESVQPSLDGATTLVVRHVAAQSVGIVRNRLSTLAKLKRPRKAKDQIVTASVMDDSHYAVFDMFGSSDDTVAETETVQVQSNVANNEGVIPNRTQMLAQKKLRLLQRRENKVQMQNREIEESKSRYFETADEEAASQAVQTQSASPRPPVSLRARPELYPETESDRGYQMWAEGFGTSGEQEARDGIASYGFSSSGLTVGVDTGLTERNMVYGAFVGYAASDVDSADANSTNTALQTYQLGGYGQYHFKNDVFLSGTAIYSLTDTTTTRSNIGATTAVGRAEYDIENFSLFGELGRSYDAPYGAVVTPSVAMFYNQTDFEYYRDIGAGGLGANVHQDSMAALEIGPQVEAYVISETDEGLVIVPEARLGYLYDLFGDEVAVKSSLQGTDTGGGGLQIPLEGSDPQVHSVQLGTGLGMGMDSWQIQADYDYEWKGDFSTHTGSVNFNYRF